MCAGGIEKGGETAIAIDQGMSTIKMVKGRDRMRKIARIILSVLLCVSLLSGCAGSNNPTTESTTSESLSTTTTATTQKAEPVTIKFWTQARGKTQNQGVDLPQEEWTIIQMINEYMDENPNVKIEFNYIEDQVTFHQQIKAHALAKDGPDIANLWAGTYVSTLTDILLPLTDYMPQEDLDQINGWESFTHNLASPEDGGIVYGYPCGGNELGILVFNRKIISACGLDFDANPPKTVDEFTAALETIKGAGYLPIISADSGYAGIMSFAFGKWWAQNEGYDRLSSNETGKTTFSEDQGLIKTFTLLQDYYKKGYINKDYATIADDNRRAKFLAEEAALITDGNWSIQGYIDDMGSENVGILSLPDLSADVKMPGLQIGGMGQSYVVLNYTKYPQECVDFLSWLNNRENAIRFGKADSKFPYRLDTTAEDYGYEDPMFERAAELAINSGVWYEFAMTPTMVDVVYAYSSQVITGAMKVEDFTKLLDEKAVEIR